MNKLKIASAALMLSAMCGSAFAKLPPLSEEAQAAAAAAKAKSAWTNKVNAYKLCLAQNKTANHYFKTKNSGGKSSANIAPCADPGPYVAAQAATKVGVADSKPVPAAGKEATPPAKK